MSEEEKMKIAKALSQKLGNIVCPICHQSRYTLLDGYFASTVQKGYKGLELGGRVLPSVMLVCNNCGHLDNFSLGVLGLMDAEDNNENQTKGVGQKMAEQ